MITALAGSRTIRPSIAVLPFEVLSEDTAISILVDPVGEHAIAQLARGILSASSRPG